jgi:putative glutamine amidotransferase
VLTGGADVDPSRYGAVAHSMTDRPRPDRDAWEAKLCLAALDAEIPVLAVCRGLQVMNVALGGTLHQHLPDLTGTDLHRAALGQMTPNHIEVASDSTLAAIVGSTTDGMCHHHQAVDHPGRGLRVVARAADGTIEGMEIPGRGFAIGVQWHPESNDLDDRLFKSVVEAAAAYRRRRTR